MAAINFWLSLAAVLFIIEQGHGGVIYPQPITGTSSCSEHCDRTKCVEPNSCLAGLTWDRCLCCRTCARREGDRCDLGAPLFKDSKDNHHDWVETASKFSALYVHGPCGNNLECKIRTDLDEEEQQQVGGPPETTCVCTDQNSRCGSDNQTYATLCAINEEAAVPDNKRIHPLEVAHAGPCRSAPKILQSLENHIAVIAGTNVMFTCDVEGFPLPQIAWQLRTVDGQTRTLPDGDGRISVSSRGASRPDRVTSWLHIIQVSREHEGDFICTVENELAGSVQSTGRLLVAKQNNVATPAKAVEEQEQANNNNYYNTRNNAAAVVEPREKSYESSKPSNYGGGYGKAKRRKGRSADGTAAVDQDDEADEQQQKFNDDEVQQIMLDDVRGAEEADDSSEF